MPFSAAYKAAESFSQLYAARQPGAGFLEDDLVTAHRLFGAAGLDTARHLLGRLEGEVVPEEELGDEGRSRDEMPAPEGEELHLLRDVERNLASVVDGADIDPKVKVILHYLQEQQWLEKNGAIIFSQYLTTAEWVAEALCASLSRRTDRGLCGWLRPPSFSRVTERRSAGREQIKSAIQNGDIRLGLRHRRRLRGPQPSTPGRSDQCRPAVEPVAA